MMEKPKPYCNGTMSSGCKNRDENEKVHSNSRTVAKDDVTNGYVRERFKTHSLIRLDENSAKVGYSQ